jgi:hypothetical protein
VRIAGLVFGLLGGFLGVLAGLLALGIGGLGAAFPLKAQEWFSVAA